MCKKNGNQLYKGQQMTNEGATTSWGVRYTQRFIHIKASNCLAKNVTWKLKYFKNSFKNHSLPWKLPILYMWPNEYSMYNGRLNSRTSRYQADHHTTKRFLKGTAPDRMGLKIVIHQCRCQHLLMDWFGSIYRKYLPSNML